MQHRSLASGIIVALAVISAQCQPHGRSASPDEISRMRSLERVMEAQQAVAQPQFDKMALTTYSDADWPACAEASSRLQATSLKIKDFSRGPEFDALAMQLHEHAVELGAAASSRNAKASREALRQMKSTCDQCHAKYR
jgi:soluble cytochrome b562